MTRFLPLLLALLVAAVWALPGSCRAGGAYSDDETLATALKVMARHDDRATLSTLATSPGKRPVWLLTIAPAVDTGGLETAAVLVVGDPRGVSPLGTEAALELARRLLERGDRPTDRADSLTWYLVPRLDPDGAARFFAPVRVADGRNDQPRDDDADGLTGEDPADDLDGDGVVRLMLVPDPEGRWLLTDESPRLPREAKPERGEHGRYLKLVEGDDDDGDGEFNEDGAGGVVPGRNFPHGFEHWTTDAGPWAAYAPETRSLLRFACDHPEIALVLTLGETNTLAEVPGGGKKPKAGGDKYKIPGWLAEETGLDPDRKYTLDELVEMGRDFTGNRDLTAEDVLSFLGLGIPTAPHGDDLSWWKALSEHYADRLKEIGLDGGRVDPAPVRGGSLEEWAYYQLGVPSLAIDFWTVPKQERKSEDGGQDLTPDDLEKMTADEIVALGTERIAAMLEAYDAPPSVTPEMVVGALQGGMLTPAKIADMMREQAEKKEAGGVDPDLAALAAFAQAHPELTDGRATWAEWREVTLADGRTALVGGPDPFALRNPPAALLDSLLAKQVPLLLELPDWLPRLGELELRTRELGGGAFELTAVLPDTGRLPYPTAMGKRTRRIPPVVVTLEGGRLLDGRPRRVVPSLPAGGCATVTWVVHGKPGTRLTVTASAPSLGTRSATVTLEATDSKGGRR